jgi:hypothetical protein
MPTGDNKVHVSRNGSLLGVYDLDQLGDMLERGQLNASDQFYDEASETWVPLSEWKPKQPLTKFRQASEQFSPEETGKSGQRRRGGKSSRSKKRESQGAIFGWIACLFALVVAAGIFGYAATLQGRVKDAEKEILDLNALVDKLKREHQTLTEITPAGRVRAIITYEPSPNQVAIMSGATVGLYRRQDVESALVALSGQTKEFTSNAEAFEKGVEALKTSIPSPIEVTLTDSNGRVDLPVKEPGDYVLVASAGKSTPVGLERYLWLVGFRANALPSGLILMNEKNATSLRTPAFSIVEMPSMVSGTLP